MKPNHNLRNATIDDVPAITGLYITSVQRHFAGTLPDEELAMWTYENEAREFACQIRDNSMSIRMLLSGSGDLLGFTRFGADDQDPAVGRLESIFVGDVHHRKGYGTALLEDARSGLQAMGFGRMILWTPTKGKAHGFYRKLGGRPCGQKINEIQFDITAYEWALGG